MGGDDSGLTDVYVADSSPLAGITLRSAPLPLQVFILAVERDGATTVPTGDSTFEVGDRLTVLGDRAGLEELTTLAAGLHRA
jgi:Trk K+ transport system NAD-binding subunit